jgi:hypothetical protein
MCGNKLVLIDRLKMCDLEWDEFDNLTKKQQEEVLETKGDSSYWVKCSSCHCFGDDFPLVIHHPCCIKSEPGDSWSLSWVK